MQPSIIFLLLGCFAFANSFSIDLGFLNPLQIPGESAVDANLCKPIVRINTERDSLEPSVLTNNPGDVTTRRFLVPLPTLAPSSTSTTTRIYDKNFPNPMADCDPVPISIGRQLGTNLLGIFQSLG